MLPDVGAGTPLTQMWWVAAIILMLFTIGAMVIGALIWRWVTRPDERDDVQTANINALRDALQECKISCAERRNDYVGRKEFEARMIRFEDTLGTIFDRVHRMALKMGVADRDSK